jgi:DNA polymerase-3 subunit gamma/tau
VHNKPYIVFARKYRPTNFLHLQGQDVLVKVINTAIKERRLAHAYLLTGIRGVGKTTSARIIAKAINCSDLKEEQATIIPCEKCTNCVSISQGGHPDIIEMDAASRTGVDDIRDIIDGAQYKPLLGRYKVFIIDEVHMLSKNAFNALLKLLEEPPAHVIFIFATTEVNKIPVTIISRCQRFDLKRLDENQLYTLLAKICQNENVSFEEEALNIIALKSDGSARDALSLLDQAVSLTFAGSETRITEKVVAGMVGATNLKIAVDFTHAIFDRNTEQAIAYINEAYKTGIDLVLFTENVLDYIANITKAKTINNYRSQVFASYAPVTKALADKVNLSWLTLVWQLIIKGLFEVKNSYNMLHSLEMLAIKAIYTTNLPSPKELVEQITNQGQNEAKALETSHPRQF